MSPRSPRSSSAITRIAEGRIAEITAFHEPGLFPAFGLPAELPPADR